VNPDRRPTHQTEDSRTTKETIAMNRYQASIPRAACGLAAIAISAAVFAITVMLPSGPSGDGRILAIAKPARTVYVVEALASDASAAMAKTCDDPPSDETDSAAPQSAT